MSPFRALSYAIAGFIAGIRHNLQLLLVIHPIELFQRTLHHLNPRLYSERLRIRRVSEGRLRHEHKRFVLFVFYGRESIPAFTQTVIDAIARRGLNLVISTNAKITAGLREALLEKSCLLIERADLGRDFGGYKDGISIIEKRFGVPDRLILLNDSLFYFNEGLDRLIEALDGDDDLIGMCEDFYHYYHIQSFAVSFSKKVLEHARLRRYWRKFRPVSTRRWAIGKGERGLTRQLLRAGFKPRIIYSAAQLVPHLRRGTFAQLLDAIALLPADGRAQFLSPLEQLRASKISMPFPMLDSLSKSLRQIEKATINDEEGLRKTSIHDILAISQNTLVTLDQHERWALESIGDSISAAIGNRNQVHFGGFLYVKYLGMPAIKRDLFYRELYSLDELEEYLAPVEESLREEVMADIRQKGTARLLVGLQRVLYQHGSI